METQYKYESAMQWLIEFLGKQNHGDLLQEAFVLAQQLDNDAIQDLYQDEMDKDGFFEPISQTEAK